MLKRTTIENRISGTVVAVENGAVFSVVKIQPNPYEIWTRTSANISIAARNHAGIGYGSSLTVAFSSYRAKLVLLESNESPSAQIQNLFKGSVERVDEGAAFARITILWDGGAEITLCVPLCAYVESGISIGDRVGALVSANSVVLMESGYATAPVKLQHAQIYSGSIARHRYGSMRVEVSSGRYGETGRNWYNVVVAGAAQSMCSDGGPLQDMTLADIEIRLIQSENASDTRIDSHSQVGTENVRSAPPSAGATALSEGLYDIETICLKSAIGALGTFASTAISAVELLGLLSDCDIDSLGNVYSNYYARRMYSLSPCSKMVQTAGFLIEARAEVSVTLEASYYVYSTEAGLDLYLVQRIVIDGDKISWG